MNAPPRPGKANGPLLAFIASVFLLAGLVGVLAWDPQTWFAREKPPEPLVVYCAAGLRAPMELIVKEYEAARGVPVQVQYGGSQTLLTGIEVSCRGDLYIPADDSYLVTAREKGLIGDTVPLARMTPVLVVKQGNPKSLRTLDDLLKPGVRLAQGNPDATAIGSVTRDALRKSGQWDALNGRTAVFKMTVNDVANDVQVGAADAGIVWDSTVSRSPGLETIALPEFASVRAHVAAAILRDTTQPDAARAFAQYLAARDHGLKHFAAHGFELLDGSEAKK